MYINQNSFMVWKRLGNLVLLDIYQTHIITKQEDLWLFANEELLPHKIAFSAYLNVINCIWQT